MPQFLITPLFAAGGGEMVVALLLFVFTVVGWLVNLANNQNNPPAPPQKRPRPPRPKANRVQNDIDIFLQEVQGGGASDDEIMMDAVAPDPRRAPPPRPSAPPPPPVEEPSRKRLSTMESQLDSHVGETLASHHLESHVGEPDSPISTGAKSSGDIAAVQPRGGRTGGKSSVPLIGLLKSRQGIQQAILVNEILSKPLALRDE